MKFRCRKKRLERKERFGGRIANSAVRYQWTLDNTNAFQRVTRTPIVASPRGYRSVPDGPRVSSKIRESKYAQFQRDHPVDSVATDDWGTERSRLCDLSGRHAQPRREQVPSEEERDREEPEPRSCRARSQDPRLFRSSGGQGNVRHVVKIDVVRAVR